MDDQKKKVERPIGELKKTTITYFIIVMVAFLIDILVPYLIIKGIAELVYLVLSILVIINCVKLIKQKEYALGICFRNNFSDYLLTSNFITSSFFYYRFYCWLY